MQVELRLCVKSNKDGMLGKDWEMWAYFIGTELQVENTPSISGIQGCKFFLHLTCGAPCTTIRLRTLSYKKSKKQRQGYKLTDREGEKGKVRREIRNEFEVI